MGWIEPSRGAAEAPPRPFALAMKPNLARPAPPAPRAHRPDVPGAVIDRLRAICLALPEAIEEPAWVGWRWRIRTRTFAHVLMVDAGWPPAYAKVVATDGPACVLTFRSALPELDVHAFTWEPFLRPGWWPDIVGMRLGTASEVDWDEVAALVAASYRRLAPKKLAERENSRTNDHAHAHARTRP